MIPAPFEYVRPQTLDEALRLLGDAPGASRPIAGGQSLLPLMKLRLARPERLVDIGRFAELRHVRDVEIAAGGGLAIGALATWSDLLEDPRILAIGALRDAIPGIGDVAVRNRGTIGGSLAHADPAADIAAPLLALDAEVVARSADAERVVRIADLFVGPFTTALEPTELLTEVRLPPRGERAGSAYVAVLHPASGYPIAGAAAVLERADGSDPGSDPGSGRAGLPWVACRVGVTGVGERPFRATATEASVLAGAGFEAAARGIAGGQRVLADPYADREYRAAMASVVARRALELAATRALDVAAGRATDGPVG